MELTRRFNDFFRKIKSRLKLKGRLKKKLNNCHWPEFNKYCGCCALSTGIYIRSLVAVIISALFLAVNGSVLHYLLSINDIIRNANLTAIEGYLATSRDQPERDLETLKLVYTALVIYYIVWISFKSVYIVTVVFTAYAIYRKNSWMLKVLLFISVPNCVLDFLMTFFGSVMLRDGLTTMLIICNLSEIYNILAINSEYKRMRGKSRLAVEDIDLEPPADQMYVNDYISQERERYHNGYNQLHCRSCKCFEIQIIEIVESAISPDPSTAAVNDNLNNAIAISNENILNINPLNINLNNAVIPVEEHAVEAIELDEVRPDRPNTLDLNAKGREDISDVPIIYDEEQLNVGLSPIIEDRRENSSNV